MSYLVVWGIGAMQALANHEMSDAEGDDYAIAVARSLAITGDSDSAQGRWRRHDGESWCVCAAESAASAADRDPTVLAWTCVSDNDPRLATVHAAQSRGADFAEILAALVAADEAMS